MDVELNGNKGEDEGVVVLSYGLDGKNRMEKRWNRGVLMCKDCRRFWVMSKIGVECIVRWCYL